MSNEEMKIKMNGSEIAESMANTFRERGLLPEDKIPLFQSDLAKYLNNPDEDEKNIYRILNILFSLAAGKFDREQLLDLQSKLSL